MVNNNLLKHFRWAKTTRIYFNLTYLLYISSILQCNIVIWVPHSYIYRTIREIRVTKVIRAYGIICVCVWNHCRFYTIIFALYTYLGDKNAHTHTHYYIIMKHQRESRKTFTTWIRTHYIIYYIHYVYIMLLYRYRRWSRDSLQDLSPADTYISITK